MKTVVSSADAPAAIGPYSQAIGAGQLLFCSGQLPVVPKTGDLVAQDASAQARQVLENLGAVLKAGASCYAKVVKTTLFLPALSRFASMDSVYSQFFPADLPAQSTLHVPAIHIVRTVS